LFGEWSFEKWSHSENGCILAVPRIGRSENGHSKKGRSEIGRSENGRSENGRCTKSELSNGTKKHTSKSRETIPLNQGFFH
jgi:hypothetical protein